MTNTSRSKSLFRGVEIAANLATLGIAVFLAVVILRSHVLTAPAPPPAGARPNRLAFAEPVAAGTDLSTRLPGVSWEKNGRTLVLALSTRCHFCTESMPFFRQVRKSLGKDVTLVGLLPEPAAQAESYLKREGMRIDELKQVTLGQVGVTGTPTMLLVDRHGIVIQVWVGKLKPGEQQDFFKTILSAGA